MGVTPGSTTWTSPPSPGAESAPRYCPDFRRGPAGGIQQLRTIMTSTRIEVVANRLADHVAYLALVPIGAFADRVVRFVVDSQIDPVRGPRTTG